MEYALESDREFERLEKQSQSELWNFIKELQGIDFRSGQTLLDAGCGSGIVARYYADFYPQSHIVGCDFSQERIEQAKTFSRLPNLTFKKEDVTQLTFKDHSFDHIVCRYVLEHMNEEKQLSALKEFKRCLKPSGQLTVVDIDGYLFNIFPQTETVREFLEKLATFKQVDMNIGRKLPSLLMRAGFNDIKWSIQTLELNTRERKDAEYEMIRERLDLAYPVVESLFGSELAAKRFVKEYLEIVQRSESVLFWNKFLIVGK